MISIYLPYLSRLVMKGILLLLVAVVSPAVALEAVKNVVVYRVEMPTGIVAQEDLIPGLPHEVIKPANLLLEVLLAKDDCTVKRLGKAPIIDGTFTLDQTKAVYYFQPNGIGNYALKTSENKLGVRLQGTVSENAAHYAVSITMYYGEINRRVAFGSGAPDDKEAMQFLSEMNVGMPEMNKTETSTTVLLTPGSPMSFGATTANSGAAGQSRVTYYFILLD